ncbi:MAG: porin [Rudaea sp.]|uniref:porin n=1 Tax=Rudaea sp. TaxID=2136325 RepID=UPI0039E7210B
MSRRLLPAATIFFIGTLAASQAGAVSLQAGDWTVDIGGIVNAYYTSVDCTGDNVGGAALAGRGLGCAGQDHKTTIGNGLLPDGLVTKFKTSQDGIEIGGTIGIYAATATSSGIAANSGVDVRQAFFTIGTAEAGTLKLGRDYGIFGSSAILSDMTLLGIGAPVQATQIGRVSLGHIGAGYTYLGNYGQLAYTSPVLGGGFTFNGALVSPVDVGVNYYASQAGPQYQAQLAWAGGGFKAWIGGKMQHFADVGAGTGGFSEKAGEIGASFSSGPFGVLANFQTGKGLGILTDGDQGNIKGRNFLVQGTFMFTDKLKFGLNYGESRNSDDNSLNATLNSAFKSNSNVTGGLYYSLTKSITLAAELGQTRSKDYLGNSAKMVGGSFGGIVFF